jgi:hypothetical protein
MEDWDFADLWEWDAEEEYQDLLYEMADELAERFFLSNDGFLPDAAEDYSLGYLDPEDWWPLVNQLDEMLDLEIVLSLAEALDGLLGLPGVPTELLEDPYVFLASVLEGNLPPEPSGRRVGSRKLVKIALAATRLLSVFPETARAAVRAWADVHRRLVAPDLFDGYAEDDLTDLPSVSDLPPAMTGFSMLIALTLMRWPDRAEGLTLPPGFAQPALYDDVLTQWEGFPDNPTVTEEGTGEAEALFAQGQLAHTLAQMGAVELMSSEGLRDEEMSLAYSQLSRGILWVHNQCRHCPERDQVACKVAANWPERPVPLLDIAGEIASTGRIVGCIKA